MKKFTLITLSICLLALWFNRNTWKQYQGGKLIPMLPELRHIGGIPLIDELDKMTWITAPMIIVYDKEHKIKCVKTYIYEEKTGKIRGYYSVFNQGNFKGGYMYGTELHGQPIRAWPE